ncbi:MAG TPA: CHASE2 domain-containing protein [Cytophagales bacterium]|nr:CHASE2 domain-containing protein [Cytophagales bacterium]
MIPFPNIEILDPLGQTLNDFDVTDLTYNKVKGYAHKGEDDSGHKFEVNEELGDTNIIIVNIGEQPRGVIGLMINAIDECKPMAIGLDVIFKDRKPDTLGDMVLAEAIKSSGKVVLASKFIYNKDSGEVALQKSHDLFSSQAQNSFVNLVTDGSDDIAKYKTSRSFYPRKDFKGIQHNFFAIDLAAKMDPHKAAQFLARNKEVEYINYVGNIAGYGDAMVKDIPKFYSIDYPDVLSRQFDPGLFRNKIVLMGFLGRNIGEQDIEDIFYSPLNRKYVGKTNPDMFGVVIHANIINMILSESYIDQVPSWIKGLMGFIICYISVVVLYITFLAYPLLYGTLSKIVQLIFWLALNFAMMGVFYKFRLKYDADIAVITVILAGDMVEIYHELVQPTAVKLYRLIFVKKEAVLLK